MKQKELKYGQVYRHNFPQYAIISFFVMFMLALIVIIVSSIKNEKDNFWIAIIVFIPIIFAHFALFYFFRKMRIVTYKDRIVIYLKKFKDLSWKNSYKYGYTIYYTDIQSIDLMPIKTFGFLLSHQINIKLTNNEMVYINGFSNLDVLCVDMRHILIYSRRHPSEFIPSKEKLANEGIPDSEEE